ncbi:hypothetical protein BGZ68_004848 [Mortierella alpina]|nr:hypothetical protein BGZ68_004848 [Mortierella alpina]
MLNYLRSTAIPDRGADIPGTTSTTEGTANQPNTTSKKKKKKKKSLASATPAKTENHPSATLLTAAKAAVAAAEQAAEAAEQAAKAAETSAKAAGGAVAEAANAAIAAKATAEAASEAAEEAAIGARAAKAAAGAAAEALKAAEAFEAAQKAEASAPEEATGEDYVSDDEYAKFTKSKVGTTFLYVPVEGPIQVRQTSTAGTEEILEWPYTEGHSLSTRNTVNEGYILTGFIRSFHFDAPVNKRYSKLYGPSARIHGPGIIYNESNGGLAVSLTEKDIPKIFR